MAYTPRKFTINKKIEELRRSPENQQRLAAIRSFFFNNLLLIGAIVVTLSLVYSTTNSIEQNSRLQTEINEIEAEVSLLEEEIRRKQLLEGYYQSDEFLELETRKQLGLVSPGEKVIVVPDVFASDQDQDQEVESVFIDPRPQYQQNLDAWFNFFFDQD